MAMEPYCRGGPYTTTTTMGITRPTRVEKEEQQDEQQDEQDICNNDTTWTTRRKRSDEGWYSVTQVLVVPPLECAWLPGDGYAIEDSCANVLYFEARGTNDATILFTTEFGSRRCSWYGGGGRMSGYTIIIGSHRNSCVKIEKNGVVVCVVQTPGGIGSSQHPMELCGDAFRCFWVSYDRGEIRLGFLGEERVECYCVWKDEDPVVGIRYVGLSCWDSHVGYRNVRMVSSSSSSSSSSVSRHGPELCGDDPSNRDTTTLSDVCLARLSDGVSLGTVCEVLVTLDSLCCDGDQDNVLEEFVSFAATNIEVLSSTEEYRDGFRSLPLSVMERIITHQSTQHPTSHSLHTTNLEALH